MAAVDVQNRVAKATNLLPAEVTQVGVLTQKRQTSMLMGVALYCDNGEYDEVFIDNYMKINVIPQLQRVNGVGDVMSFGADYSMRVWLKPDVMAQYRLMPSDVAGSSQGTERGGRSRFIRRTGRPVVPVHDQIPRTSLLA